MRIAESKKVVITSRFCESQNLKKSQNLGKETPKAFARKYFGVILWVVRLRATQIRLKSIKEASNKLPQKHPKDNRASTLLELFLHSLFL